MKFGIDTDSQGVCVYRIVWILFVLLMIVNIFFPNDCNVSVFVCEFHGDKDVS